jgi:predicted dehydrogenase
MLDVDGVVLVSPPATHRELSYTAMGSGKPVLCEKPLAESYGSALEIVEKSNQTGVPLFVAQDYRYKPEIQTLKNVLESGDFGQVSSVSVNFFKGIVLSGFHQNLKHPLLIDMAVHHFDLMRFLLGSEPVSMYASSWNPGYSWFQNDASTSVNIRFDSGAIVNYTGSWTSTGMETSWNGDWRFECEKGVVSLVDDRVRTQRRKKSERVVSKNIALLQHKKNKQVPEIKFDPQRQHYLLEEFRCVVQEDFSPATACQDNIKSLAMVFDAIRSIETSERVVMV